MSKFIYSAMFLSASISNDSTYFREPISPSSSAPQKPNRTALWIPGELPNCKAVSRTATNPDPLSLMPGPSGTLSRCAPAITTSLVDPVLVCAITLRAWMVLVSAESCTVAGPGVVRSSAPSDLVTLTTGILTSVVSPRVPPICSSTTLSYSAALQPGLASVGAATSGPVTPTGGVAGLYSSARASNFLPATVTDP